jgi:large subunit ribosomal protein L19
MSIIDEISKEFTDKNIPKFKAGDTIRVYLRIREGEKERVQYFEGYVIGIHKNGISSTFKVRKESYGVGVERTFPLFSPLIQKIVVKRRGDVRRGKLYYLRELSGKKARVKEKKDWMIKKEALDEGEMKTAEEEVLTRTVEDAPPAYVPEVLPQQDLEAKEEVSPAPSDQGEKEESPGTDTEN